MTVKKRATAQVEINPKPLEPGMRRVLRVVTTIVPVVALAACVSPTAPSTPETTACLAGKVPYATCANKDYINPLGDYINPLGDYINPLGNQVIKPGE